MNRRGSQDIGELLIKGGYAERLNQADLNLNKSKPKDYNDSNSDLRYVPTARSDFIPKPPQYLNSSAHFPVSSAATGGPSSSLFGSRSFGSSRRNMPGNMTDDSESTVDDENYDEDDRLTIDSLSASLQNIDLLDNDENSFQGQIELRGPYSPLEVSYHSIANIGFSKRARIERDSINYPSIDDDPTNTTTRLLVAGEVSLNAERNGMILRKTSLMPKLPGLSGLCCLLFAPFVEMRADEKTKSYYSGVLCGLGFDEKNRVPIYADNDIECTFDVKFDTIDLEMVRLSKELIHHVTKCPSLT